MVKSIKRKLERPEDDVTSSISAKKSKVDDLLPLHSIYERIVNIYDEVKGHFSINGKVFNNINQYYNYFKSRSKRIWTLIDSNNTKYNLIGWIGMEDKIFTKK